MAVALSTRATVRVIVILRPMSYFKLEAKEAVTSVLNGSVSGRWTGPRPVGKRSVCDGTNPMSMRRVRPFEIQLKRALFGRALCRESEGAVLSGSL